jgi:hypothetical protein
MVRSKQRLLHCLDDFEKNFPVSTGFLYLIQLQNLLWEDAHFLGSFLLSL